MALWCGCLLLLLATTGQAAYSYASITVSGYSLQNGTALETLVLATSSFYSTFGNATTIQGTPTYQFSAASTFIEGCDAFSPPTNVRRPWIAIIQRGTCTYFSKAMNAALSGASGVIIVDNVISNTPVLMSSTNTEPKIATSIVSVSLTYNAALRIMQFMDQHNNVSMRISPGDDAPADSTAQPSVSFMFLNNLVVGVVAIGAFSFCVMFGFYMRSRNRRFVPAQDPARAQHLREAREMLIRLPTRSFVSLTGHALDDNESPACAVCLENFKDADLLRTLPCKHEMHQTCIDPWLSDHSTCPLCKRDICDGPAINGVFATVHGADVADIVMNPLAPSPRALTPHAIIVVGPMDDIPPSPQSPNAPSSPNAPFSGAELAPNTDQVVMPLQSVLVVEDVGSGDVALASSAPSSAESMYMRQISNC
jgi:hypothetical protein